MKLSVLGYEVPAATLGDNPNAPMLICVNAAQQTMGAWGWLGKRFMRRGYRVGMFDFPNQGSALEIDAVLGLIQQADLTAAVAEQLSPDRPVALIGASWGSLVSAACAARHPERVSRLFLGSFQARTHPQLIAVCARCVELIDSGRAREELADFFIREFGAGLPDGFRIVMRKQFASLSDAQLKQMRRQTATLAVGADLREIVDLKRITAKVLIVNGVDDPLVDVNDREIMDRCFPNAETHILAGVGHFLHLERPALIDLYLDFMRGTADDADLQPFTMPTPTPRQETVMLTELQKQKFTRMFHAIDANQNGCIETADAARLASELARVRGYTPGDPQYEATQRRYLESMALMLPFSDAAGRVDNAGFLAYHDWLLNTPGAYQLAVQRLVEFVFTALDEDGDGEVTLDEAREFYVACGMSEAVAETVFARIDLDNDGFLTQAEVTDIVTQYYFSSDPQVPGNWLFGPFPGIMAVTL